MSTPSAASKPAVSCRLNARFKEALSDKQFYPGNHDIKSIYGHSHTEPGLRNKKNKEFFAPFNTGSMRCCGLREFDFQGLAKALPVDEVKFAEAVAVYLQLMVPEGDQRVVIVGIPTAVGQHSQYNLAFYDKLRETLQDFGFRQAGMKYENSNSHNEIVALIGQMPE